MEENKLIYFAKSLLRYMFYASAELLIILIAIALSTHPEFSDKGAKWYIVLFFTFSIFFAVLMRFMADEMKDIKF